MSDQAQDLDETAYPASENVPGQKESRASRLQLLELDKKEFSWWEDYLELRSEGWTWRKAVFIAWASSPTRDRYPKTEMLLATEVLGLKTDRSIRKWKQNDPTLEERIVRLQAEPLMRHRRDVIDALVSVARDRDPKAHSDRRMFLEMTGDYKPKGSMALTDPEGGPLSVKQASDFSDLDDDELTQLIANLQTAAGTFGDGAT